MPRQPPNPTIAPVESNKGVCQSFLILLSSVYRLPVPIKLLAHIPLSGQRKHENHAKRRLPKIPVNREHAQIFAHAPYSNFKKFGARKDHPMPRQPPNPTIAPGYGPPFGDWLIRAILPNEPILPQRNGGEPRITRVIEKKSAKSVIKKGLKPFLPNEANYANDRSPHPSKPRDNGRTQSPPVTPSPTRKCQGGRQGSF